MTLDEVQELWTNADTLERGTANAKGVRENVDSVRATPDVSSRRLEEGASEEGASEAGASEAGASEEGASDAGASEEGASEKGASEEGASEKGASEGGASEEVASEAGASKEGASEAGASEVASEEGASEEAASEEGASHSTSVTSLPTTGDHIWGYNWTSSASLESWLIDAEQNYGGFVGKTKCMRGFTGDSSHSTKTGEHFCIGGDRMAKTQHNYAHCYAQVFHAYRERWSGLRPFLIAEVGILNGSGVAIWSQLFPHAEVHGFDLDLTNTRGNLPFLRSRGAFAYEDLRLHSMNQLEDNVALVGSVAQTSKFSLVIDDGYHTDASIENTFASFKPHLGKDFVYFVEDLTDKDNGFVSRPNAAFQAWQCPGTKAGQLWVLTSKTNGASASEFERGIPIIYSVSGESLNHLVNRSSVFQYIFGLAILPSSCFLLLKAWKKQREKKQESN